MGFLEKLQSKIDLYRLERKYARRSNRNTFSTGATYVDGEYVYNTDSTGTLSASSTGNSSRSAATSNKRMSSFMGRR